MISCTSKWAIEELNLGPHAYQASIRVPEAIAPNAHSKGCDFRRPITRVSAVIHKKVAKSSQAISPDFAGSASLTAGAPVRAITRRERRRAA
jgi:hypothetical protein